MKQKNINKQPTKDGINSLMTTFEPVVHSESEPQVIIDTNMQEAGPDEPEPMKLTVDLTSPIIAKELTQPFITQMRSPTPERLPTTNSKISKTKDDSDVSYNRRNSVNNKSSNSNSVAQSPAAVLPDRPLGGSQ